jgi:DNA-binding NtrC family response regulator
VVEDKATLRYLIKKTLRIKGYRVFSAANAEDALSHSHRLKLPIDLLLVDLVLPNQSGVELAGQLSALRPGLRVAYMSGYAGAALPVGNLPSEIPVLEKPFPPEMMLGGSRR